ncbi:MAG: hypothetical protein QNJ72_23515 [Pleurocapsa sp. MO_226.B13]|nr:hypothetical protein [Pleurocapsa sp. MO_226.B13]
MMIQNKRLLSIGIGLGALIFATQRQLTYTDTSNSAHIVSNGLGLNGLGMNGAAINQLSDSPADHIAPSQVQATLNNQTGGRISTQNGQLIFRVSE